MSLCRYCESSQMHHFLNRQLLITVYCNLQATKCPVIGRISCCVYHGVSSFPKSVWWRYSCRFHANSNETTAIFRAHFVPFDRCPGITTVSRDVERRGAVVKFWRRTIYKELVMKSVRQFNWSTETNKQTFNLHISRFQEIFAHAYSLKKLPNLKKCF